MNDGSLDSCPFCGDEDPQIVTEWNPKLGIFHAHIACSHCSARGTSCGDEMEMDAVADAMRYWNEAGRPGWWSRNVVRRWNGITYDIRMLVTGGYDRRAYWKDLWR